MELCPLHTYCEWILLPHPFARNLAYVRWTALALATNCKRDSYVGLVHLESGIKKPGDTRFFFT